MAKIVSGAQFGQKFINFDVWQCTYKIVNGHKIRADIFIPQSHTGDSLYEDWFPTWLLDLAEEHNAVIISANYRFLPEATGLEILDDIDDFWNWIHSTTLAQILKQEQEQQQKDRPVELDLDRILTAGDSAGGLLSIYLTLSHPDKIRAATATYPALHWDVPSIYSPTPSAMIGTPPPESFIDEYVANIKPGQTESSDLALQRVRLSSALTAHRRGAGFYIRGADASAQQDRLFQLSRLQEPGTKLPRGGLVILHGVDDDVVPVAASQRFVDKAREVLKGRQGIDRLVLCKRPGNHGFDASARVKEEWLADALQVAIKTWLE